MKEKIFEMSEHGPFRAKVDERYHKLGQDCPDDGWVTGYLLRDLHKGEVLPHIFNCPCWWIVQEETIEPVGFLIAQWIKVEDRLPKEGQLCVIRGRSGWFEVVRFEIDKGRTPYWRNTETILFTIQSATHWLPIIEPKID
jgi:hypothetical protein